MHKDPSNSRSAFWDERSKTFPRIGQHTSYVDDFLALSAVQPNESVLDMGCGTGAIAIPLAVAGHRVVAADFSHGMLDVLRGDLADVDKYGQASQLLETKLMSWEDDWTSFGLEESSVDVALASRSIITEDLPVALSKLTWVARRRVCVTLPTGCSPHADAAILRDLGIEGAGSKSALCAFTHLCEAGIIPEVRLIRNERVETFDCRDEARMRLNRMVNDCVKRGVEHDVAAAARNVIDGWLDENLIPNPDEDKSDGTGEPQKRLRLKRPREIVWAFLSWSPIK